MNEEYQEVLHQPPKLLIGKNGVTSGVIEHIVSKMKHLKMMKVKVHKEAVDEHGMDYFITEIFKQTKLYVLDVRGHTFILSKKKADDKYIPAKYRDLREQIRMEKKRAKLAEKAAAKPSPPDKSKPKRSGADLKYDFIDYDNEEQLEEIDKISDEIYGEASNPNPEAQAKVEMKRSEMKRARDIPTKTPKDIPKTYKKSPRSKRKTTSRNKKIQKAGIRKGKPGFSKRSSKKTKSKSRKTSSGKR